MGAPIAVEGLKRTPDIGWRKKAVAGFLGPASLALSLLSASTAEARPTPSYPCDPDRVNHAKQTTYHELAQLCLNDRHGKIALVGYDIDQTRLGGLAERTQAAISRITKGLMEPEIIPVVASPAVEAEFHQLNATCIDTDNVQALGAKLADDDMDLELYDHVVSVSDVPACVEPDDNPLATTEGLAYSERNWRYATEFGLSKIEQKSNHDEDAFVLVHEILHDEGLGHVGTFRSYYSTMAFSNFFDQRKYKSFGSDSYIDLSHLLSQGTFMDNAAPYNVMGVGFVDKNDSLTISSLQRWRLEWPERVQGDRMDWLKSLNGTVTMLANPEGPNHDFGVLNLDYTVAFTSKGRHEPLITNQLVLDPIYDPQSGAKDIIELFFANNRPNKQLEMVSLGYLDFSTPVTANKTLTIDNQTIAIQKYEQGYAVSVIRDGQ